MWRIFCLNTRHGHRELKPKQSWLGAVCLGISEAIWRVKKCVGEPKSENTLLWMKSNWTCKFSSVIFIFLQLCECPLNVLFFLWGRPSHQTTNTKPLTKSAALPWIQKKENNCIRHSIRCYSLLWTNMFSAWQMNVWFCEVSISFS